jgi:hypothetical protein
MHIAYLVLMILAFACFLVSATGANPPRPVLLPLGLMFWSLAEIAGRFAV